MNPLKYLSAYPAHVTAQVQQLLADDKLGALLLKKYPSSHSVRTDQALFEYVTDLKTRHLRKAAPINKVGFDATLPTDCSGRGLAAAILKLLRPYPEYRCFLRSPSGRRKAA